QERPIARARSGPGLGPSRASTAGQRAGLPSLATRDLGAFRRPCRAGACAGHARKGSPPARARRAGIGISGAWRDAQGGGSNGAVDPATSRDQSVESALRPIGGAAASRRSPPRGPSRFAPSALRPACDSLAPLRTGRRALQSPGVTTVTILA